MNMRKISRQAMLAMALMATGLAVSSCRDGHPGHNSDRHHGHHRDGPYHN